MFAFVRLNTTAILRVAQFSLIPLCWIDRNIESEHRKQREEIMALKQTLQETAEEAAAKAQQTKAEVAAKKKQREELRKKLSEMENSIRVDTYSCVCIYLCVLYFVSLCRGVFLVPPAVITHNKCLR